MRQFSTEGAAQKNFTPRQTSTRGRFTGNAIPMSSLQIGNSNLTESIGTEGQPGHNGLVNAVREYERLGGSVNESQEGFGYTIPRMSERYQGLYGKRNPIPPNSLGVPNQVSAMETYGGSGYDDPQNPPYGHVDVLDYPDSLSAKRVVSMATASVSGYTYPRSLTHGCVDVQNYRFPPYLKIFPKRPVSMTTRSASRYTNPNSLTYGYVGATDYSRPPSRGFTKKACIQDIPE